MRLTMNKNLKVVLITLAVIVCFIIIYFAFTPSGRRVFYSYTHSLQMAEDDTLYRTRKDVEDTCRSMQSSYESDKLVWLQWKDSDDKEHRMWAEQAMMRANKTAAEYNNYIVKNNYVWKNNIPSDIYMTMKYLGVEE